MGLEDDLFLPFGRCYFDLNTLPFHKLEVQSCTSEPMEAWNSPKTPGNLGSKNIASCVRTRVRILRRRCFGKFEEKSVFGGDYIDKIHRGSENVQTFEGANEKTRNIFFQNG